MSSTTTPDIAIRNKGTELCMEASSLEDGSSFQKLVMNRCDMRNPNQRFKQIGNNMYQTESVGKRCLDDGGGRATSKLHLVTCDRTNPNQTFVLNGGGQLSNPNKPGLCVDAGADGRATIGSFAQLYQCAPSNPNQQFEHVFILSDMCKGDAARTNPTCYNYCQSIQKDTAFAAEAAQCNLDQWQQGYCTVGDRIVSKDNSYCYSYCNPARTDMSASVNEWCNSKRKAWCEERLRSLQNNMAAHPTSTEVKTAYRDFLNAEQCACYLPDDIYNSYITDLKNKMGLVPGKHDLVIQQIENNMKCLYPPCGKASRAFRPFTCPSLELCFQNISVDIRGSTIEGSSDVNATQNCLNQIQETTECKYSYGPWTDCTGGKQSQSVTPAAGSSSECKAYTQQRDCTAGTSPSSPPTTPPTPPAPAPPSTTGYVVLGVAGLIGVILLFLLVWLLVRT